MAHSQSTSESNDKTTLPRDEQEILDSALLESDQLLVRSLHDDQQRRRKRILWLSVILVGGVAMTTVLWFIMTGLTAATVSRADVNEAQQLSKEGWQLWQKQQFADAEEKFAKSVELNPKDADAWNGLGWTQFNGGRSTEAIKAFEQCVKLKPKHPAGLNGLGQIYLMWGELPQAEKYLKKAAPNAPAAWYGLARLYLIQGDFKKAKPWVERLAQDPNNVEAQRMLEAVKNEKLPEDLKIMLQPAGKPEVTEEVEEEKTEPSTEADAALEDLRRTIICYDLSFDQVLSDSLSKYDEDRLELFPTKSSWPDGLMANLVRSQPGGKKLKLDADAKGYSDDQPGTFEFTEPLSAPVRVDNYQTLLFLDGIGKSGSVLIDSYALVYCHGDVEGIINSQSYSTTVIRGNVSGRLRNASYGHWVIFGKFTGKYEQESSGTLRILGGFDGEIKLAKRAKVYLGGKTLASALERIDGAGTVYLEESDLEPGEHQIGRLTVIVGDLVEEKPKLVHNAIDQDNTFQEAWQVFFSRDYENSEEMFRSVLEKTPENPHAMNGLGWSLLNQKKYEEAKPWLEKSITIEENHWGALTGMAVIMREEGKLDEAVAIWERIAENSKGPNDATINLADYYLEQKEFDKAAKCYRKLIEWYPDQNEFKGRLEQAEEGLEKEE
ncbi:tetratricopeptide repeat protein [Bythopirellula polymerisocia]|uniref:TPR repeat-containing protein YrrB n=1 Tax=Bythopirellula polymerisocia TaxID=2528003 RepID=A0A5C6D4Z1_9BACT|nr:tetratricopeptide repeat protein [Bythopirellula polymerisocia]TWU30276.1 TPR repeat-containing protein YrrB [Bythopirellula polymerisocia]